MIFVLDALPLAITTVLLLAFYKYAIYPAYLSPLAKIPSAHWTCSISPLWIFWKRMISCQNKTVYAAHLEHGPIVRLGPNELSVNCIEDGVKTIYAGAFQKDDYYAFFNNFGTRCMFTTPDSGSHAARRRFISQIYSKSSIHNSPIVAAQARTLLYDRLLPILEHASIKPPSAGVAVYSLWQAFTMDTIAAFYLGLKCGTNFLEDEPLREKWRGEFLSRLPCAVYVQEMPNLTAHLAKIGIHVIPPQVGDATRYLEATVKEWYQSALHFMKTHPQRDPTDPDVPLALSAILAGYEHEQHAEQSRIEKDVLANPEPSILSELMDNITAGYETTGITMTYLSWQLSQDLNLQSTLRKELLTLDPPMVFSPKQGSKTTATKASRQFLVDPKALDALPLLHAVLMETMRLHPVVPGAQPRIVPPSGGTIGPYKDIPGGVRVGSSLYVLHRNTDVFPDPEKWDPTRWLDDDKEAKREREGWFFAFSGGPRMCPGNNFAIHELKMLVAGVYTNYTTHIVNDSGIEQRDGHTAGPKGDLFLRFERAG